MTAGTSDGWFRLEAERRWTRWLARISPLDLTPSGWWDFLVLIGLTVVWVLGIAVLGVTISRPRVNTALRQIRIGRRIFDFAQLRHAGLSVSGGAKHREVDLTLELWRGPMLYVQLVSKGNAVVDAPTRSILVPLLEGSSIETAAERRTQASAGRPIARGLTREDALAMVRNPPVTDSEMPRAF